MPLPRSTYCLLLLDPNPAFPVSKVGVLPPSPRVAMGQSQRSTWQSHQRWSLICYHHEVVTAFSAGEGGEDLGMNKVWDLTLRGSRYNGGDEQRNNDKKVVLRPKVISQVTR